MPIVGFEHKTFFSLSGDFHTRPAHTMYKKLSHIHTNMIIYTAIHNKQTLHDSDSDGRDVALTCC